MPKQRQSDGGDSLANLIKSKRKRENLTQSQAAEAWGISRRTLEKWELGTRRPHGLYLAHIEKILSD